MTRAPSLVVSANAEKLRQRRRDREQRARTQRAVEHAQRVVDTFGGGGSAAAYARATEMLRAQFPSAPSDEIGFALFNGQNASLVAAARCFTSIADLHRAAQGLRPAMQAVADAQPGEVLPEPVERLRQLLVAAPRALRTAR